MISIRLNLGNVVSIFTFRDIWLWRLSEDMTIGHHFVFTNHNARSVSHAAVSGVPFDHDN